jgi:transposase
MPKKTTVPDEVLQSAVESAKKAKTADELRMALAVIFPVLLGVNDQTSAELLGRCRGTVVRMRKQFKEQHSGTKPVERNWGGRRRFYISLEEEKRFLSSFQGEASRGGVLSVVEIRQSFESLVGCKVAKTTIYRMLDRHGWRKILPRPRHPKSDQEAQEGFKKTPKSRAKVR